jgi:hypothetical protein
MDESRIGEMLEVPGMETQEPATYPAPVRKKRRTAAMHAEDRVLILSKEIRELPGVCGAIMTPAPAQHPLTCETCGWFQMHHIYECDISGAMSPAMLELIKKVGCASHSSAAGEAVLDRLEKWIDGNWCGMIIRPYGIEKEIEAIERDGLMDKIKELRAQQKGEQG